MSVDVIIDGATVFHGVDNWDKVFTKICHALSLLERAEQRDMIIMETVQSLTAKVDQLVATQLSMNDGLNALTASATSMAGQLQRIAEEIALLQSGGTPGLDALGLLVDQALATAQSQQGAVQSIQEQMAAVEKTEQGL